MRIAIIGSGISGMAAAILLRRVGHEVSVFERKPLPVADGAGFLLQPTGQAVLARLGLLDQLTQRSATIDCLHGQLSNGKTLFELHYRDLGTGYTGLGVHRGRLFELLLSAMKNAGVVIHCGVAIANTSEQAEGVQLLAVSSGEDARDQGVVKQLQNERWDLAIAADGSNSVLRHNLGLAQFNRPYPWGAWWALCQDHERLFSTRLEQRFDSAKVMIGVLPLGSGFASGEEPLTALFWSLPTADIQPWSQASFSDWKKRVSQYWPAISSLIASLERPAQLLPARYVDAAVRQPWQGRTVFIGDAAHAMSPQLGQGANLALLDAVVLCDALAQFPIDEALPRYWQARQAQVRFYQRMSRWLTPFYQSHSSTTARLRDLTFPQMARHAWLYKQMLMTLGGLKTGAFSQARVMQLVEPFE